MYDKDRMTILTVNSGTEDLLQSGCCDSHRDAVSAEQAALLWHLHILEREAARIFVTASSTFGVCRGYKPKMFQIYSLLLPRQTVLLSEVPDARSVSLKLIESWTTVGRELELEVFPGLTDQVAVRKVKYFSFSLPAATEVPGMG